MARRAERRDVVRAEVLHLVDQQRDTGSHVAGQLGDLGEQLDQVDLDVAGVGPAVRDRHVDPGLPAIASRAPSGCGAQRECLQHTEYGVDPVRRPMPDRDVADRAVQRRGQRPPDRRARARFDLAGPPAQPQRHRAQLAEQDGLPTPRSPVSTRLRSGRPRATRSSSTSKASSSESRPASSGGRCPAPGAKGLRIGSTLGPYPAI